MLAGCVAGPDYVRPAVETPPAWKLEAPWREGTPDDAAPKGPWWQRFGDARLDALQAAGAGAEPDARARQRPPRAGARGGRGDLGGTVAERQPQRARRAPAHLGQPAAQQLRLAQLLDGAERRHRGALGQLRVRPRRPRPADASKALKPAPSRRRPTSRTPASCSAPTSRPPTSTCARSTSSSTCWRARSPCSAARSTSSAPGTTSAPPRGSTSPSSRRCSTRR